MADLFGKMARSSSFFFPLSLLFFTIFLFFGRHLTSENASSVINANAAEASSGDTEEAAAEEVAPSDTETGPEIDMNVIIKTVKGLGLDPKILEHLSTALSADHGSDQEEEDESPRRRRKSSRDAHEDDSESRHESKSYDDSDDEDDDH